MHLLFFSAQYLPTVGGVERYTHSLAGALAGLGHRCTIATSALPGQPGREQAGGVTVVRLPARLPMMGRFPVPRFGRAFRAAAEALWAAPVDLAVIQTRFYPLSVWAAGQCRRRGIPAIVVEHGTKHLSLDHPLLDVAGNLYEHAAMAVVRRRCRRFYGVSRACVAWLRHFHLQAEGVLYNAIDTAAIDAITAHPPCDFRSRYGLPAGAPLVVFSGRFIREKGVAELLEAFALLRRQLPGAALLMAGDGPMLDGVRAAAPPGVVLAGTLTYQENVALLAQGDVFCLPTYSEGFSNVILEAAAAGCCIVTTPTGGSPELITSGESGILLEGIDPPTIAAALHRALTDPAFRASAGARVRQAVEERFTWNKTAQALLAIAQEGTRA